MTQLTLLKYKSKRGIEDLVDLGIVWRVLVLLLLHFVALSVTIAVSHWKIYTNYLEFTIHIKFIEVAHVHSPWNSIRRILPHQRQ